MSMPFLMDDLRAQSSTAFQIISAGPDNCYRTISST
jgi:hypothetical protein